MPLPRPRRGARTAVLLLAFAIGGSALAQQALGPAFTYQGELRQAGVPAQGSFDLRFRLFDAADGGNAIGATIVRSGVTVEDGLFRVALDFGPAQFAGERQWLAVEVRPAGGTTFEPLLPRTEVTAAPYAWSAATALANSVTTTSIVDGTIKAIDIDGAEVQRRVSGTCPAGQAVRSVAADGSVTCGAIGDGMVTNVATGAGLTGGPITGSGTIAIAQGGVTSAMIADGTVGGPDIDPEQVQRRVAETCDEQKAVRAIAADGSVICTPIGAGTVTEVATGAGLTGGPIMGSGTIAIAPGGVTSALIADGTIGSADINAGQVQRRVSGSCPAGQYIQSVAADGSVVCGVDASGASGWSLSGNAGTNPATQFIGTTDAQPLELRAGNARGLRIEPSSVLAAGLPITANVTAGSRFNSVIAGARGATIAGGGTAGATDPDIPLTNSNFVTDSYGAIGGGADNVAGTSDGNPLNQPFATISGGRGNAAGAPGASIGGGVDNVATGSNSVVAGGQTNQATTLSTTVGGGQSNRATGAFSTVSGGSSNQASNGLSTVSGGGNNIASGNNAAIGGGFGNTAGGTTATIAGGWGNVASTVESTIGGGRSNTASASQATVGGGEGNLASGSHATVGGGRDNAANATQATIGGGQGNLASGPNAVVGGGLANDARGSTATIGGGQDNLVLGQYGAVAGGVGNEAALRATVGGGDFNVAAGVGATIAGGTSNQAVGLRGAIGGGLDNDALGAYATVPGGRQNCAGGDYSFAGGRGAASRHGTVSGIACAAGVGGSGDLDGDEGAFVWGGSQATPFVSTGPNQFLARATGGVAFNTNQIPVSMDLVVGGRSSTSPNTTVFLRANTTGTGIRLQSFPGPSLRIAQTDADGFGPELVLFEGNRNMTVYAQAIKPGGGAWAASSDARLKHNIEPLGGALDRLLALHGVTYEYLAPDPAKRPAGTQVGFVAQEVQQVFPDWVSTDRDGYLMVAPRGFEALTVEALRELRTESATIDGGQERRIAALEAENARLAAENAALRGDGEALRQRVERLEARIAGRAPASR